MIKRIAAVSLSVLLTTSSIVSNDISNQSSNHPKVAMGNQPSLTTDTGARVNLKIVSSEIGQKELLGNLPNGDPVLVTQYEKPEHDQDGSMAGDVSSGIDWIATATEKNPGIVNESINENQIDLHSAKMVPSLATAITKNSVSIEWAHIDGVQSYEIIRDGKFLTSVTSDRFDDKNLKSDTTYEYKILPKVSDKAESKNFVSERNLSISTRIGNQSQGVAPMAYQPYGNAVEYKTFIPAASTGLNIAGMISCGIPAGTTGITFGGDNRSYQAPTANAPYTETKFRTIMWANVNWGNPDSDSLILLKGVQPTYKYKNGVLVDTKTASNSGQQFLEAYRSGAYAQVRFKHDVGNPFCSIGSIQYNVMNRIYRSGLIEMVGWRFQAPSHEAYARFNPTGAEVWKTLIRRPVQSFDCTFEPACAIDNINVSVSG